MMQQQPNQINDNKNKKKTNVSMISAVYEGVNTDGTKMTVNDSFLWKLRQPSFATIPQTPLDH